MAEGRARHSSPVGNRSAVNSRGLIKAERRLYRRGPRAASEDSQALCLLSGATRAPSAASVLRVGFKPAGSHFISRPLSSL